jgi:hypothetical protein
VTAPIPPAAAVLPAVMVEASDLREGCTGCGTQATVLLHPHEGRRCPACMTIPPGPFRRDLADDMVEIGRAHGAFAYLTGWLLREAGERFDLAVDRTAVAW